MRTFRAGNRETQETQRLAADVERAAMQPQPFLLLQTLHSEPEKLFAGMLIRADGSDFDPDSLGTGEGLYQRNAANTAWVFIG